jgi:hypothetical protein
VKQIAYIISGAHNAPISPSATAAAQGFSHFGYEIQLVSRKALTTLPLSANTVVVGGVDTVRAALNRLGAVPEHLSIPECLTEFAGRRVWTTTVFNLFDAPAFPVFVKPRDDTKAFTGRVVTSLDDLESLLMSRPNQPALPDEFPLLCQEPVCFFSEWRCFVLRGVVVGTSHYKGDPLRFPDADVISNTINAYKNAPAGYSADFGVLEDGRTVLVEVNDGYALGSGGLLGSTYAELLRARWEELTIQLT